MKAKPRFYGFAVLVAVCIVLLPQPFGFAADVRITDITVTDCKDDLLLSLKVDGAFKKEMDEAILNGIPTTFSFFIKLKQERTFWPDRTIRELKVTHTIKYNNLKNNFTIQKSWEGGGSRATDTDSFETAKQLMSEIKDLKLVPLSRLQKGKQYQVKAKAELAKVKLPFFLNYIFLTFLWDFETPWQSFTFTY